MSRTSILTLIALGASLAAFSAHAAEMPTDAQKEAVKSHCRSDFLKNCKGITPGGPPAFECLVKNMDSLSSACQAAVQPIQAEVGSGG